MSPCNHALLPLVRDACADDQTVLALSVLRSIAAGYMTGDIACWDTAFDAADHFLGDVEGPRFVAAMASLVRAVRTERQGEWRFLPATCCRVTRDEQALLALLATSEADLARASATFAGSETAGRITRTAREARATLARSAPLLPPRPPTGAAAGRGRLH